MRDAQHFDGAGGGLDRPGRGGEAGGTTQGANPRPSGMMVGNGGVGSDAEPARAGDGGGVAGPRDF